MLDVCGVRQDDGFLLAITRLVDGLLVSLRVYFIDPNRMVCAILMA